MRAVTTQWLRFAGAFLPMLAVVSAHATPQVEGFDSGPMAGNLSGVVFSLVVVIAAVIVVAWLYARSRGLQRGSSQVISILAAQALGPKERIVLVEVGGKQMVLGMTAAQVQTLHVFDEPVVSSKTPTVGPTAFSGRLRQVLKGMTP